MAAQRAGRASRRRRLVEAVGFPDAGFPGVRLRPEAAGEGRVVHGDGPATFHDLREPKDVLPRLESELGGRRTRLVSLDGHRLIVAHLSACAALSRGRRALTGTPTASRR